MSTSIRKKIDNEDDIGAFDTVEIVTMTLYLPVLIIVYALHPKKQSESHPLLTPTVC